MTKKCRQFFTGKIGKYGDIISCCPLVNHCKEGKWEIKAKEREKR